MHRSDWYFVLMPLGCLALAGLALSDSQYRDQERIAAEACATQNPCKRQQAESERAGLPRFAERFISNPEPNGVSEKERRDLAAQEANAVWAFYTLLIAGVSAVVTAIGTALLYQQIVLTRKAVEETGLATVAMGEANEIARQSMRPWLHVTLTGCTAVVIMNNRIKCSAYFEVKNVGNTPANIVQIFHETYSRTMNAPEVTPIYKSKAEEHALSGWGEILPPNGETTHEVELDIVIEEENCINVGDKKAINPSLLIVATYSSVGSRKTYQTGICFLLVRIRDGRPTVLFIEPGIYGTDSAGLIVHPGASIIT